MGRSDWWELAGTAKEPSAAETSQAGFETSLHCRRPMGHPLPAPAPGGATAGLSDPSLSSPAGGRGWQPRHHSPAHSFITAILPTRSKWTGWIKKKMEKLFGGFKIDKYLPLPSSKPNEREVTATKSKCNKAQKLLTSRANFKWKVCLEKIAFSYYLRSISEVIKPHTNFKMLFVYLIEFLFLSKWGLTC